MDPDREAPKPCPFCGGEAIRMNRKYIACECGASARANLWNARRDLARLEGEKPKKASLGELVEHVENSAKSLKPGMHYVVTNRTSDLDLQAAAVLRAVGEFRERWMLMYKIGESDTIESCRDFLRSLP
jgi:hypothetical protein